MRYELDLNTESVHICVHGYSITVCVEVSPAIDHGNRWVIRYNQDTIFDSVQANNDLERSSPIRFLTIVGD
jgi:hypothetical protein